MPDIPECLNRRYRVLDELVMDLTNGGSCCSSEMECSSEAKSDVGIKMLCSFWKILKENPDYNLSQAVQQRMDLTTTSHRCSQHQHVTCYMAGCQKQDDKINEDKNKQTLRKLMNIYCGGSQPEASPKCCASKSVAPSVGSDVLPLSKVLCNLKEAASFDKKCNERLNDLMLTQKELKNQIEHLEHREKEGTRLLKQADCMWSCMEDTYKKKIAESLERQKDLLKQLKEVETSATKWRKNKKDLEMQMDSINKCQQEIKEKTEQKTNDIKCMDMEIAGFKKRIENNKKDTEVAKKSLGTRKQASDAKIANLAAELSKQQKKLAEQNKNKQLKENEGSKYVKEAREELHKICTVLLERKLKNEDLKAEKEALNVEIGLLRQTRDKCTEKCNNKEESINDEIKSIEKEIAEFKIKCIRCHQCTDTNDVRKLCTDCPKCAEERECIYEDDHCSRDFSMDCVCMSVKQKFLDNVFDNMYTVLERQTKTNAGKYVADVVLNCLKRSRNGKLDDETRKVLHEFVLTTVKNNLTLTIIGGAVKTRCEMDPDTYKQLMLCLRTVKSVRPPKEDKGTAAKKEACGRWGGSSECNCPKGPKACLCSRKAPPPPNDPTPCLPPEKVDAVETTSCRHKKSTACGPDRAMHAVPSRIGLDLASLRPAPCNESSCSSPKNMRTAQCLLGSDSICSSTKGFVFSVPYVADLSSYDETVGITSCCHKKSTAYGPDCAMHAVPSRIGPDLASLRPAPCNECSCSFPKNTTTVQCLLGSDSICSSTKGFVLPLPYVADLSSYNETVICKCGSSSTKPVCRDIKHLKTAIQQQTDKGTNIDTHHKVNVQDILQEVLTVKEQINKELYAQRLNEICKLKTVSSTPGNFFDQKTISEPNMFIKPLDNTTSTLVYSKKLKQQKINDQLLTVDNDMNIDLNNLYIEVTNTASGHLAIELDDKVIEMIENKLQEEPNICIFAKKTDTGQYIFDINTESNTMTRNQKIAMKKTLSGNNILEINKDLLNEIQRVQNKTEYGLQINDRDTMETSKDINTNTAQTINKIRGNDILFKIKIKDIKNNIKEPPAVLHVTPSNNYIVVLDKEYEKYYLQTVNDYIGDSNNECLVELHKTTSNNYMITLSDMGEDSQVARQNALLIKSPSGYIKILVNGPTFDAMDYAVLRKTSTSSIKAYVKLLNNLPNSSKDLHGDGSRECNLHHAKFNIDSDLYSNEKLKDQQSLVADSSVALKRICSGHYAVVLNGDSNKTFVKNLKDYLNVSQGLIPLKRTESSEIIIMLNGKDESNIGYGSLKITPSGNIYVIVDEKVIQVTSNDSNINNDDIGSKHIIDRINHPVNKSVTTTCNAKPDSSFCNPSKCVCDKLGETQKWLENSTIRDSFRLLQPEDYSSTAWKNEKANKGVRQKVCNPKKYANTMKGRSLETCDCSPVMNDSKSKECYFMVDPICANIDQYDALSNDLFEISKLSNETSKDDIAQRDYKKYEDTWDSLSYLPPQLPAFLTGYKYH